MQSFPAGITHPCKWPFQQNDAHISNYYLPQSSYHQSPANARARTQIETPSRTLCVLVRSQSSHDRRIQFHRKMITDGTTHTHTQLRPRRHPQLVCLYLKLWIYLSIRSIRRRPSPSQPIDLRDALSHVCTHSSSRCWRRRRSMHANAWRPH